MAKTKTEKVMHEFKHGQLHSGSKHGPLVKKRRQAIAIALSEQRKADSGGYADGGIVGMVSRGMEAAGRAFNTEKGKKLKAADEMLSGRSGQAGGTGARASQIADAEKRALGYADGGYVGGGYVPDPRMKDGGLLRHRDAQSGQYANGGMVQNTRADTGPRQLSAAARQRFSDKSRGRS